MSAQEHDTDDFRRGYAAGYAARVREELSDYLTQIKAGHAVYDRVIRDLVELPTSAERRAAREATLREAHAAELHANGPAYGCPVCEEARAVARRDQERADARAMEARAARLHAPGCRGAFGLPCSAECGQRDAESDRHHNVHYGVAHQHVWQGGVCVADGCPDYCFCIAGGSGGHQRSAGRCPDIDKTPKSDYGVPEDRPLPPLPETIEEAMDQLHRTAQRFPGALGQRTQTGGGA